MDFESQEESERSEASNKLGDERSHVDPWDEESPFHDLVIGIDRSVSKHRSKTHNKEDAVAAIALRKPRIPGSGGEADKDGGGGRRGNITDLPCALVAEILYCLDPKELGIVSCVSTLLNSIASGHHGWKEFYRQRWGLPVNVTPGAGAPDQESWKKLFVERDRRSKSFMGRYSVDVLHGHAEAVRAVFILPSAKLVFTGGYDSVIRMWDLEEALSLSISRPLGCTIRAIAADSELLVAGGSGAFLQCWLAVEGNPRLFEISATGNQSSEFRLRGHEGPVTCLALDSSRIYSGSWDMSVRIWDRARRVCANTLRHGDWVWALSSRGSTIASTAGRDVYVWNADSGELANVFPNAHTGNAFALARSHSGDLLFTGGEDGAVRMFQVVGDEIKPATTWIPHARAVNSVAFEYPWVVSSSGDGRLALIDVRKLLRSGGYSSVRGSSKVARCASVEPPQRMLQGFAPNLSVGIGADRIVCGGGEDGTVRVWDFSRALEIEMRVQALRSARVENRMRRRKAQVEMNGGGGGRNQIGGGVWHSKRGVGGKLKT